MKKRLLFVLTAVFVFTQTPVAAQQRVEPLISSVEDLSLSTWAIFPSRGGNVDFGLALSGGGIRSGSYSVGVLKALYDAGLLKDLDAIASVSGGGFANYWLFSHDIADSQDFGGLALNNDTFLRNVCELKKNSQMFSLRNTLVTKIFPGKGFKRYRSSIGKTFQPASVLDPKPTFTTLKTLRKSVQSSSIPLPVFNVSIASDRVRGVQKSVEVTPFYIGNEHSGYARWSASNTEPDLLQVIATSAAGDKGIRQTYSNFGSKVIDGSWGPEKVKLYDGGCSENLGALPLIRRGLKYVIIVDAEHDPRYRFEGYVRLKEALGEIGIDLKIPDIEKEAPRFEDLPDACPPKLFTKSPPRNFPFKTGLVSGEAFNKRNKVRTKIFYLKMSESSDVFPDDLALKLKDSLENYEAEVVGRFPAGAELSMQLKRLTETEPQGKRYTPSCSTAPGEEMNLLDLFSYRVNRYSYYSKRERPLNRLKKRDFFTYEFPQTTTADQSFYPNQMEAFIGLGYLQAQSLAQAVKQALSDHRAQ